MAYAGGMIIERMPEVLALPTDDKAKLAEELLDQVRVEMKNDPALREMLRRRLSEHSADPESGVRWEDLRDRLIRSADA